VFGVPGFGNDGCIDACCVKGNRKKYHHRDGKTSAICDTSWGYGAGFPGFSPNYTPSSQKKYVPQFLALFVASLNQVSGGLPVRTPQLKQPSTLHLPKAKIHFDQNMPCDEMFNPVWSANFGESTKIAIISIHPYTTKWRNLT
jgi:hypothetical protein